jgi:hypothetical protein
MPPLYTRPMPRAPGSRAVADVAGRIPGLRRLPLLKIVALGEVALLAREHVSKLKPSERRRLLELTRSAATHRRLSENERAELGRLVAKAEPRLFAALVADKLSPVALPGGSARGLRRR